MQHEKSITPSYSIEEIETALSLMGIEIRDNETTDPYLMHQILHEIGLDIKMLAANDSSGLLKRLIHEKITLLPIKKSILLGISHNPPIAQTLIEASENFKKNNKISITAERMQQFQCAIYFAVILQVITRLCITDKTFENTIVFSVLNSTKSINPGSTFWNFLNVYLATRGDFFRSIKRISVDPLIFYHLCWREYFPQLSEQQLEAFINKHHLTGLNASITKKLLAYKVSGQKHYGVLCGNIFEALVNEESLVNQAPLFTKSLDRKVTKKSVDNVKAGLALILYHEMKEDTFSPGDFIIKEFKHKGQLAESAAEAQSDFWHELYHYAANDNVIMINQGVTDEWMNLYEAWNIAFCLRRYSYEAHLILPMLFIPDTLSSYPENYLSSRMISLWLTVNFTTAMIKNRIKVKYPELDQAFLLEIFGKNNVMYANDCLLPSDVDLDSLYKEYIQAYSASYLYIKAMKIIKGEHLFNLRML